MACGLDADAHVKSVRPCPPLPSMLLVGQEGSVPISLRAFVRLCRQSIRVGMVGWRVASECFPCRWLSRDLGDVMLLAVGRCNAGRRRQLVGTHSKRVQSVCSHIGSNRFHLTRFKSPSLSNYWTPFCTSFFCRTLVCSTFIGEDGDSSNAVTDSVSSHSTTSPSKVMRQA